MKLEGVLGQIVVSLPLKVLNKKEKRNSSVFLLKREGTQLYFPWSVNFFKY
jgi:hypothetical protein